MILNHMGIVLLTLMRPHTAGVHRRARVMVVVELSPTAGATVTERGEVRNAATAEMGGMSAAHAASTTPYGKNLLDIQLFWPRDPGKSRIRWP